MGTFLVFFLGLVIVAGLLFLLASFAFGRGEEMAPAPPDSTPVELPDDRPVAGDDVRAVRLSVTARGYRMREVDWVLEQLAVALDDRDRQLAEIRRTTGATPGPITAPVPPRESASPAPVPPRESASPAPVPPRESASPAPVPPRESGAPAYDVGRADA